MKYLVLVGFILSIAFLAFVPEQSSFPYIICGFSSAFACYILLIRKYSFSTNVLIGVGFAARILCVFAFPNLSDDIYRFVWDGHLLHLGESPFVKLPSEYIQQATEPIFAETFPLLNSPDYYSIYPPFAQAVFYVSTFSWMNSAMVIKLLLLLAEAFTVFFSVKLLRRLGRDSRHVLWYVLNPLIIIEILVNIHFEGFMVCFFTVFTYLIFVNRHILSSFFISLSIAAKLIPLMFLPYFLFNWPWRRMLVFYLATGLTLLVMFAPIALALPGFTDSLDLYFRKFEFNASVYYMLRYFGSLWKGYNMIAVIGPSMAVAVLIAVLYFAFKVRDFFVYCQWSLLVFLLLSTTIHPWYLSLGILLSIFTGFRFFILWSFLVVLSYSKYAFSDSIYYWFVAVEYVVMLSFLIWEILKGNKVTSKVFRTN